LLFGLYPNLAGSKVQTVSSTEKIQKTFDAEMKSKEMEKYITELKDAQRDVDVALVEKEKTITKLEAEVQSQSTVLKHYRDQCEDLKRILVDTQDKLIQVTNKANQSSIQTKEELRSELSKRDQDIQDMLYELRMLQAKSEKACEERQLAISEARTLKSELGNRTSEMLEMRNLLQIIQTETECTRNAVQNVQEKQDHLSILKEQIRSYQEKYEYAQGLLSSKSELIQTLQQKMSMLHEKVIHLNTPSCAPSMPSLKKKECDNQDHDSVLTDNSAKNLMPSVLDNSVSVSLKTPKLTSKEGVTNLCEESKQKENTTRKEIKGPVQISKPCTYLAKARNIRDGKLSGSNSKETLPKENSEKSSKPMIASRKTSTDTVVKKAANYDENRKCSKS